MGLHIPGAKVFIAKELGIDVSRVGHWCPCQSGPVSERDHIEHFYVDDPATEATLRASTYAFVRSEAACRDCLRRIVVEPLRGRLRRLALSAPSGTPAPRKSASASSG